MKNKKHLKYEEKSLLLKHHFQSNVNLEQLSEQFGVHKGIIYNWLRKIDYDFDNIEKQNSELSSNSDSLFYPQ